MVKQYEENLDEKKKSEKISQKKVQPLASQFSMTLVNKSLDKQLRLGKTNAWIKI